MAASGICVNFMCLSESSFLGRSAQLYYSDNGMYKYKTLFNQLASPRTEPLSGKPIITLCFNIAGSLAQKMNHFFHYTTQKTLRIWSHLLERPLMENFIFCAVLLSHKSNKEMKKGKIRQVNCKSQVTTHGLEKQKEDAQVSIF